MSVATKRPMVQPFRPMVTLMPAVPASNDDQPQNPVQLASAAAIATAAIAAADTDPSRPVRVLGPCRRRSFSFGRPAAPDFQFGAPRGSGSMPSGRQARGGARECRATRRRRHLHGTDLTPPPVSVEPARDAGRCRTTPADDPTGTGEECAESHARSRQRWFSRLAIERSGVAGVPATSRG